MLIEANCGTNAMYNLQMSNIINCLINENNGNNHQAHQWEIEVKTELD